MMHRLISNASCTPARRPRLDSVLLSGTQVLLTLMALSVGPRLNATETPASVPAARSVSANTSAQNVPLPAGSRLIQHGDDHYHVHERGPSTGSASALSETANTGQTTIVLLSGPSGSWFSDSRFYAALQPALARQYRTLAIDRPGIGLSPVPEAIRGYRYFGEHLAGLLLALKAKDVVIVGFASANLALHHFLKNCVQQSCGEIRVRGVLLIDPDALDKAGVEFYAEQAKDFQNAGLADYVQSGKYDARAGQHNQNLQSDIMSILDKDGNTQINMEFYEAVSSAQLDRARIVYRFAEVARYDQDVRAAAALPWPKQIPTRLWNTEFETLDIARAPDNAALTAWHQNSDVHFEQWLGACHRRSTSTEHLATFAEIPALLNEISALSKGADC